MIRPIGDVWTESDLRALLDLQTPESYQLEYKRVDSIQALNSDKKKELAKDVSAFANANGGLIIYGMEADGPTPTGLAGSDPTSISLEQLEQVLASNISPPIRDKRMTTVLLNTEDPGKVAVVFDIPRTETGGPHQVTHPELRCYFRREDVTTVKMLDFEIRDAMNRVAGPLLVPHLKFIDVAGADEILVRPFIENLSPEPCLFAHFTLLVENRIEMMDAQEFGDQSGTFSKVPFESDRTVDGAMYDLDWVCPNDPPIWRGREQPITLQPLHLFIGDMQPFRHLIAMVVQAPHMETVYRAFQLNMAAPAIQDRITVFSEQAIQL